MIRVLFFWKSSSPKYRYNLNCRILMYFNVFNFHYDVHEYRIGPSLGQKLHSFQRFFWSHERCRNRSSRFWCIFFLGMISLLHIFTQIRPWEILKTWLINVWLLYIITINGFTPKFNQSVWDILSLKQTYYSSHCQVPDLFVHPFNTFLQCAQPILMHPENSWGFQLFGTVEWFLKFIIYIYTYYIRIVNLLHCITNLHDSSHLFRMVY